MKENKCFPPDCATLREELDFYFQLCSLETHCESAAVMAATMANGEPTLSRRTLSDVLVMYDYSGQFAFDVGLPAKSGVSGGMVVVVPNLMGICLFSPPLDRMGNSTRGVYFCQKLIDTFNFHNYDSLLHADSKKMDPRRRLGNTETDLVVNLLYACKNGDLETVRRLYLQGVNLNISDYDGRTALHLAACEGHALLLKFLLNIARVDYTIKDRWGHMALDDARTFHRTACVALLLKTAQRRSREQHQSVSNSPSCSNTNNNTNDDENIGNGVAEDNTSTVCSDADEEDETDGCCIMTMGSPASSIGPKSGSGRTRRLLLEEVGAMSVESPLTRRVQAVQTPPPPCHQMSAGN
uniref:glutaminase n=1 Tax=Globodera pallida TaxID=36090 RepID=A0A183CM52_GLOPA